MSVNHAEKAEIAVLRGRPADDELAAVVTVLMAALSASGEPSGGRPRPGWVGKPPYTAPGAWTSAQVARPLADVAGG